MKLILASGSPRRAEILTQGGFAFEKRVSEADEALPRDITPASAVEYLAKQKGTAVPRNAEDLRPTMA